MGKKYIDLGDEQLLFGIGPECSEPFKWEIFSAPLIGIPFEHRERIFERFYQVDGSASRRFGGMGVGLALVWEIIEAHDGTVDVKSEPGKGSTFVIALPRADRKSQ